MKKLLSVFLSFVLILSVVLIPSVTGLVYAEETTPEADGTESALPTTIVNPTFSTTEGWEISDDNGVPQTETIAISGGKAQFTPGDVIWVGLKQTIAVTPDVPYVIQFDVCLDAASEDGIQFNVNDAQLSYPGNAAAFDGQVYHLKVDYTPTIDTLTLSIKNKNGKCTGTIDNIYVYKKGEEPPIEYPTEIQNGTFETGVEGWAIGDDSGNPVASSPVIADGHAVFANGNTAWSGFQQTIAVENEAEYIVNFNINITSGAGVQFKMTGAGLSNGGASEINFLGTQTSFGVSANGSTYTFSQKITATDNKLKIRFGTRGTNTVAYIDNVSVTRCETTTSVVNGDFSTDSNWLICNSNNGTAIANAPVIADGKVTFTADAPVNTGVIQTVAVTPGKTYTFKFDIANTAGTGLVASVRYKNGSNYSSLAWLTANNYGLSTDGAVHTYQCNVTPTTDTVEIAFIKNNAANAGWIDNVSLKEYVIPTEIQNGTFEDGVDGWIIGTSNGAGVAKPPVIKDGKGMFLQGTTQWSGFQQTLALEKGQRYVVAFDVSVTSGKMRLDLTNAKIGTANQIQIPTAYGIAANGNVYRVVKVFTADEDNVTLRVGAYTADLVGYIDNFSVTKYVVSNKVENGNFSSDSNWLIYQSNNGNALANPPTISDGKVTFTADAPANSAVIQEVAVTPGKTYTFKFDISNTGTAGLVASVRYKNGNNYTSLAWLGCDKYGPSLDGTVYTYQCNITPTTDTVEVAFIKSNVATVATVDNVSLNEYVLPTEIQNSTFEDGVDGWIIANDSGFGVANPPVIQNGQGVFSATDTNYSSFSQTVAVENGTNYMLSFDYFVESGNGIQVKFNGATQTGKTTNEFNYNTATSWVTRVVIPITASAAEFKLSFKNRGSTVGYVDNVFLYKEGEEPEIPALPEEPEEPVDPTIGAGIVSVDGDFASADNWTLASGTSISNGNLMFDGTQAVWTGATQEISLKPNTNYGIVCLHHLDAGRIQVAVKINGRNAFGEYADATVRNKVFRYNTTFNSGEATVATLVVNGTAGTTLAVGAVDLVQVVELDADGNMIDVEGNIIEAITDGDNNGLMGDLNGDYYVNLLDMVRMKKVLAGVEVDYNADAADIDTATAGVDAQDIAALKQFVLGFAKSEYVLFG